MSVLLSVGYNADVKALKKFLASTGEVVVSGVNGINWCILNCTEQDWGHKIMVKFKAWSEDVEGSRTAEIEGLKTAEVGGLKTAEVEGLKTAEVEGLKTAEVEELKTAEVEGSRTVEVEELKTAEVEVNLTFDALVVQPHGECNFQKSLTLPWVSFGTLSDADVLEIKKCWWSQCSREKTPTGVSMCEVKDAPESILELQSLCLIILQLEPLFRSNGSSYLEISSPSISTFYARFDWPISNTSTAILGHCGLSSEKNQHLDCCITLSSSILMSSKEVQLLELSCLTHPDLCMRWFFMLPVPFAKPSSPPILFTPVLQEVVQFTQEPRFKFIPKILHVSSFRSADGLSNLVIHPVIPTETQKALVLEEFLLLSVLPFLTLVEKIRLSLVNHEFYQTLTTWAFEDFVRCSSDLLVYSPHLYSSLGQPFFFEFFKIEGLPEHCEISQELCPDRKAYLEKFLKWAKLQKHFGYEISHAFEVFQLELCPDGKAYLEKFLKWATLQKHLDLGLPSKAVVRRSASWSVFKWNQKKFTTSSTFDLFEPRSHSQWACLFPRRLRPWSELRLAQRPGFKKQLKAAFPKPSKPLHKYEEKCWKRFLMWPLFHFCFSKNHSEDSKELKDTLMYDFKFEVEASQSFLLKFSSEALRKDSRISLFLKYLTKRFEFPSSAAVSASSNMSVLVVANLLLAYLGEFGQRGMLHPPSWMDMFKEEEAGREEKKVETEEKEGKMKEKEKGKGRRKRRGNKRKRKGGDKRRKKKDVEF